MRTYQPTVVSLGKGKIMVKNCSCSVAAILVAVAACIDGQRRKRCCRVTNNNSLDPADVYELSLGDMVDGELVNIDRTHQFANLPAELQGLDYVLTANDDKTAGAGFSVDLTFDAGTTLYLSIDGRVGEMTVRPHPRWVVARWTGYWIRGGAIRV